jgi:hypothetical protein
VLPCADAEDFILTVGPQMMVAVLTALWVVEFGRVRFLVWNRWQESYLERCLETGQKHGKFRG